MVRIYIAKSTICPVRSGLVCSFIFTSGSYGTHLSWYKLSDWYIHTTIIGKLDASSGNTVTVGRSTVRREKTASG